MVNELEIQMNDRQAMASLFRKKAAVMKALEGGIAKNGSNTHFNYKFMTASEIKHIVGGLFVDHGLSLQMSGVGTENAISKVERKDGPPKEVPILRIQFAISLCDMDTGAVEQSFWFGEAQATDDKAASKCATSALKYYLISNLMIADKEEDKRDTDRGPRRPSHNSTAASQTGPAPASQPVTSAPAKSPASAPAETKSAPETPADWATNLRLIGWTWDTFRIPKEGLPDILKKAKKDVLAKEEAKGAVLAYHCGYDAEKVALVADEKGLSVEAAVFANTLSL